MFVTSNVYLNIMFLHIACGFELLHNPFKLSMLIPFALGLEVEATPHLVDTRVSIVLLVTE